MVARDAELFGLKATFCAYYGKNSGGGSSGGGDSGGGGGGGKKSKSGGGGGGSSKAAWLVLVEITVPNGKALSGTGNSVVDIILGIMNALLGAPIKSFAFAYGSEAQPAVSVTGTALEASFPLNFNDELPSGPSLR